MFSRRFVWTTGHTILAYQIPLLIGLPFYFVYAKPPSLYLILISALLFVLTEISITAGYHRLFSHRSYKASKIVRFFLIFFASLAGQRSAIRWAFEHRCHHSFVDTEKDPYSIKKGFWFAHFLWLFEPPLEVDKKVVADLLGDPLLRFQDKYENTWMFLPNLLVTCLVGWVVHDFLGAIMLSCGLRLFLTHHCTFFINSLAHTYGSRPFNENATAVNNYLISFPTFGEGFHNFHHEFPRDYRNGIRWFDFDPTKWLIWTLHKLKLTKDLKRVHADTIKQRMAISRTTKEKDEANF